MTNYEKLDQLNDLKDKGAISEEEYQREKAKILNSPDSLFSTGGMLGLEENTYCMLIHLSQFCGLIVPLAGMIVPVVLWLLNKDNSNAVDNHGKIVLNWIISSFIYMSIFGILCIVIIGIPLLIGFLICNFIFIILGAIKASSGSYWKYPFSISFLKPDDAF